jgi:hypothetical protein
VEVQVVRPIRPPLAPFVRRPKNSRNPTEEGVAIGNGTVTTEEEVEDRVTSHVTTVVGAAEVRVHDVGGEFTLLRSFPNSPGLPIHCVP